MKYLMYPYAAIAVAIWHLIKFLFNMEPDIPNHQFRAIFWISGIMAAEVVATVYAIIWMITT